jgi:hypothetical protein
MPWNDKVPRLVVKITGMFTSNHPTLYVGSNIAVNKLCVLSLENANPKERKRLQHNHNFSNHTKSQEVYQTHHISILE